MFTIKELPSSMASPTLTSVQRLRKLVGYMKDVGDLALRLDVPMPGQGKCFSDGGTTWILETYSDADWSSNTDHRTSTWGGMHYLNNEFVFGSSRSQRTISLSSCESELHSIVSAMYDGIFIVACAQFISGTAVKYVFTHEVISTLFQKWKNQKLPIPNWNFLVIACYSFLVCACFQTVCLDLSEQFIFHFISLLILH